MENTYLIIGIGVLIVIILVAIFSKSFRANLSKKGFNIKANKNSEKDNVKIKKVSNDSEINLKTKKDQNIQIDDIDNSIITDNNATLYMIFPILPNAMNSIINTLIKNNISNDVLLYLYRNTAIIVNNTLVNNKGYISFNEATVVNTVFDHNGTIEFTDKSYLKNNYIDYTKIEDNGNTIVKRNNIQPSEGVLNFDIDAKPMSGSVLIDKGLNYLDASFRELIVPNESDDEKERYEHVKQVLQKDIYGRTRIKNNIIDIGAVENIN